MTCIYIYAADIYCETCATEIMNRLSDIVPLDCREDTNSFPQGPYADGGGEADTLQHCGGCGEFLENPLTSDGVGYTLQRILGAYDVADNSKWSRDSYSSHVARCLTADGETTLATWARFYDLPDAPEESE